MRHAQGGDCGLKLRRSDPEILTLPDWRVESQILAIRSAAEPVVVVRDFSAHLRASEERAALLYLIMACRI